MDVNKQSSLLPESFSAPLEKFEVVASTIIKVDCMVKRLKSQNSEPAVISVEEPYTREECSLLTLNLSID